MLQAWPSGAFSSVRRPAGDLAQQVALGLDDWRALMGMVARYPAATNASVEAP